MSDLGNILDNIELDAKIKKLQAENKKLRECVKLILSISDDYSPQFYEATLKEEARKTLAEIDGKTSTARSFRVVRLKRD